MQMAGNAAEGLGAEKGGRSKPVSSGRGVCKPLPYPCYVYHFQSHTLEKDTEDAPLTPYA